MDGARGFEESCKRMGDFRIRRYNNYLIIAKFVVRIYTLLDLKYSSKYSLRCDHEKTNVLLDITSCYVSRSLY